VVLHPAGHFLFGQMPRTKAPDITHNQSKVILEKSHSSKAVPVTLHLPKAHKKQFELITALDNDPVKRFIIGACGSKVSAPRHLVN
jgi:hypothetical protein